MSALSTIDVTRFSELSPLEAARCYVSQGLSIFPVDAGDSKRPLVKWSPYQRQVPSANTVDRWFATDFPGASIGLVAGKLNGLLAVDIDNQDDAEFFFDRFAYTKKSLTVKTPRGLHIYLQHRDGLKNNVGLFDRSIDIRTTGGYVRAPTSPGYKFLNANPVLPAPPELIAAMCREHNVIKRQGVGKGEPILEGVRNDSLFRIGCSLQAMGYADKEIINTLEAVNALRVVPPLPTGEVESIAKSITTRYPKGKKLALSNEYAHRVPPGYYICEAKRQYSMDWKNRHSRVVEWKEIGTGMVYRQFFNEPPRFSPKSKAVINYYLLFGEYPKRLDRVDFTRFLGTVALVHVVDSTPTVAWAKDLPDLILPAGLTESRVDTVVCALPVTTLSTNKNTEGG